jgi:phosphoglycolate phosphatase
MPERSVAEIDEAYARFFERHLDAIRPNPEAPGALGALRERGVATCVATNTNRRLAERILSSAGLAPLLDGVATADEAGAGKPDPAVLHLAARRLGIPLSESLFVGDSRFDEEAARRAPVAFAGYRRETARRLASLDELLSVARVEAAAPR